MRIAGQIIRFITGIVTMNSQNRKHHAARSVDALIAQSAAMRTAHRKKFWRLIRVIRSQTRLLSAEQHGGFLAPVNAQAVIAACKRMARRSFAWNRHPEDWEVPAGSPLVQLRSLVHHLFDRYPVPEFLTAAWWDENEAAWELDLYLHLAQGRSVRQFPNPLFQSLTKKMGVLYLHSPADLSPFAALNWARIRALGGDERLARILISRTLLCYPLQDQPFWDSVFRFLIQNQPISADEIVEIVHFVNQQRFEPAEKVWGKGTGPFPVQPDFSLKGRSLMSVRRHMVHWKADLIEKGVMPPPEIDPLDFPWQRSEIGEFQCELEGQIWSIEEVLTPRQLQIESKIMKHCVETYLNECVRRQTTIWSMKVKAGQRRRRQLTIEVLPGKKEIFEARGKNNSKPSSSVRKVLNSWAHQEHLTFNETI